DASASEEAAKSSEVNTMDSARAAAASAVTAADSAQRAMDSETAAARSASEAENSARRAETGADRAVQPVNDALLNTLAGPSLTPEKWNTWPQPALSVGGITLAAVNIADAPWGQKVYRGSILPGGVLYATSLQVENRGATYCCTGNNLTTLKGTYRLLGGSMMSSQHKNAANTWFICLVMRVL
ncbi:hypothetical protein FSI43_024630, partial [Escherichia coli]|nr:hypothetical protein [Escherichia coli]